MALPRFPPHRHISGRDANLLMDYIEQAFGGSLPPPPDPAAPPVQSGGVVTSISVFAPLAITSPTGDVLITDSGGGSTAPYYVFWTINQAGAVTFLGADPYGEVQSDGTWIPQANSWALIVLSIYAGGQIIATQKWSLSLSPPVAGDGGVLLFAASDASLAATAKGATFASFAGGVAVTPFLGVSALGGGAGTTPTNWQLSTTLFVSRGTVL